MKKIIATPDWTGALCAQTDPELFFPDKTNVSNGYLAKKICAKCPLIDECKFEIIDMLHFFMNYAVSIGMTSQEVYNIFMSKNIIHTLS